MSKLYDQAGVSLEKGYESVELIKEEVKKTHINGVLSKIGSFNALFDLSKVDVKNPVLVSGCDGVGTKILIAQNANNFENIGQDLVAMSVNDILVQGAQPLFFLDYIACGENDPQVIQKIVSSVATGCKIANCALVGGETAEMPDCYKPGSYDLAGFVVGVVDKEKIIDGSNVLPGHKLVAVKSNGLHSNGFSLVRKLLFKDNNYTLEEAFGTHTLEKELLRPTRIYTNEVQQALQLCDVKAMSHITGGGLFENLPRSLNGYGAKINLENNNVPEIFKLLQKLGNVSDDEMYNYFNMGIGFVFIVDEKDADTIVNNIDDTFIIGEVVETKGVSLENSCLS